MMHWAAQYIRHEPPIAWRAGAQGPDAFDCWAFFRMIQRVHFGIEVPMIHVDANSATQMHDAFRNPVNYDGWHAVRSPVEGDAVLFLGGDDEDHIGTWLDANFGGVLHCMRKSGVVFTRQEVVRRIGWGRIAFYRWGVQCAPR